MPGAHWACARRRLDDVAWVHERPLSDGVAVCGLLGFLFERLEVRVDGREVPAGS